MSRSKLGWGEKPTIEAIVERFRYEEATGRIFWRDDFPVQPCPPERRAGNKHPRGYRNISVQCKLIREHYVVWVLHHGEWPEQELDHINGIKHDNRIENLRPATRSGNVCNVAKRKDNTSGVKGVHWCSRSNRWKAQIQMAGQKASLGSHKTKEAAAAAYQQAVKELHGEFANAGEHPA